jgi:ABC-2 type transport system ATP-binding protein
VISARNLTKHYGSTVAVDDLSFDVLPGRITGFLGPNGAGKSTTMRMILGLDAPDGGEALVLGRPYTKLPNPLWQVGALLEARAFQAGRTAYNHLWTLAQSNGIARRRVDEVIDLVGLGSAARRHAGGFSLGMAQRLGIATALLGDPPVLLFDEPVNGLDPEGIVWVRGLLRSMADDGRTVLVSSHLMSEMAVTADHLIVIGRGRLIADADVAEFIGFSSDVHVRVRTSRPDQLSRVLEANGATVTAAPDGVLAVTGVERDAIGDIAAAHHLPIHELAVHHPSLETAYMELTHDAVDYRAAAC